MADMDKPFLENITKAFAGLHTLRDLSIGAVYSMIYDGKSLEEVTAAETRMPGPDMGMGDVGENALERLKYQLENPRAIETPYGAALPPEVIEQMLDDTPGIEALVGLSPEQQREVEAEAEKILAQYGDDLDDILQISGDVGMAQNVDPRGIQNEMADSFVNFMPDENAVDINAMLDRAEESMEPDVFMENVTTWMQPMTDPETGTQLAPLIEMQELQDWLSVGDRMNKYVPDTPAAPANGATPTAGAEITPTSIPAGETGQNIVDVARSIPVDAPATDDENLQKIFYTAVNELPGAGRPDVRTKLPRIFNDTKALFWLYDGEKAWKNQATTDTSALETEYGDFLTRYLENPNAMRGGSDFTGRVEWLGNMLQKMENAEKLTPEEEAARPWVQGIFGAGDDTSRRNLRDLGKLARTGGSRGYYAARIHKVMDEMYDHWKVMGMTDAEAFRRMTSSTTTQRQTEEPTPQRTHMATVGM